MHGIGPAVRCSNEVEAEGEKGVFVIKLACANLALKALAAIKLWSRNIFVMIMTSKFLFKLNNFCVIVCFLTKLLTVVILFSTARNAFVVANY